MHVLSIISDCIIVAKPLNLGALCLENALEFLVTPIKISLLLFFNIFMFVFVVVVNFLKISGYGKL